MRDNSSAQRRVEPTESLFSDTEAPSFCVRPTPLVPPPSNELRDFGRDPYNVYTSGTHAIGTLSSRPTVGPGELPSGIRSPAPPLVAIAIEPPRRPRRSGGRVIARGLLLLVLGWVLGLLGYALGPRLASALHELQTRIAVLAASR